MTDLWYLTGLFTATSRLMQFAWIVRMPGGCGLSYPVCCLPAHWFFPCHDSSQSVARRVSCSRYGGACHQYFYKFMGRLFFMQICWTHDDFGPIKNLILFLQESFRMDLVKLMRETSLPSPLMWWSFQCKLLNGFHIILIFCSAKWGFENSFSQCSLLSLEGWRFLYHSSDHRLDSPSPATTKPRVTSNQLEHPFMIPIESAAFESPSSPSLFGVVDRFLFFHQLIWRNTIPSLKNSLQMDTASIWASCFKLTWRAWKGNRISEENHSPARVPWGELLTN